MPTKTLKQLLAITFTLSFLTIEHANALSLMEAYQAALANDSIYRAALHENEAGQQFKYIGRSSLLPNLSANYGLNRNNSDISVKGNGRPDETRNYTSENAAIQLRQPIFNLESLARYRQGNLQVELSDKQLLVRKQELIQRFFGLFAQANYAEDVLSLSIVQRDSFKNQEQANKLMLSKGEGTKTELLESQAKLSLSEAQVIESQNGVTDGRNALGAMLGQEVVSLDALSESFYIQAQEQPDFEDWKSIALNHNPEISAQRTNVALAYEDIRLNRSGHSPRLDAVASISKSMSDSIPTFNQNIDNKSIGFQLNIPIFSGGSVSALTTQAEAKHKVAQDDLVTKTNEVLVDLRKQYNIILTSTLKIGALKQSVSSSEFLVIATKKSLIGGVRTNLDVLDARRQLFEAMRDLSLARFNYLVALINLKKAAGTLSVADLENISGNFKPKERLTMLIEDD